MKEYVRVTDVIDYLICPRKVFLKRIEGYSEETRYEMLRGEIIHSFFEKLNKLEKDIVYQILDFKPYEAIYKIYKDASLKIIDEILKEKEEEIEKIDANILDLKFDVIFHTEYEIVERALNVYRTMKEKDIYGIELWEELKPKLLSEVEVLSEKERIFGRIDRIEDFGDYINAIEIKTSQKKYPNYLHKVQLALYKYLCYENFPRKILKGTYLYYTYSRKKIKIDISNKFINKVLSIKDKVLEILEEKKDPGVQNKKYCSKCSFYPICYKWR